MSLDTLALFRIESYCHQFSRLLILNICVSISTVLHDNRLLVLRVCSKCGIYFCTATRLTSHRKNSSCNPFTGEDTDPESDDEFQESIFDDENDSFLDVPIITVANSCRSIFEALIRLLISTSINPYFWFSHFSRKASHMGEAGTCQFLTFVSQGGGGRQKWPFYCSRDMRMFPYYNIEPRYLCICVGTLENLKFAKGYTIELGEFWV